MINYFLDSFVFYFCNSILINTLLMLDIILIEFNTVNDIGNLFHPNNDLREPGPSLISSTKCSKLLKHGVA
jgi:hypothetical protein